MKVLVTGGVRSGKSVYAESLLAEAAAVVQGHGERPFIFNLGHGVSQETSPEAVSRLVAYLKSLDG